MNKNDAFLRQAANEYVERQGALLRQEVSRLEREKTAYPTENLEWRVKKAVYKKKRRWIIPLATAAACLALVFLGGRMLGQTGSSAPSPAELSGEASGHMSIIPLSFSAPAGFIQSGVEQDQGKSIYYFTDSLGDDVVITLEASGSPLDTAAFTKLDINSSAAYAKSEDAYQLMTFDKGQVRYTLTCRHDVNTLVRFGEVIL